jgi:hypothetical protein
MNTILIDKTQDGYVITYIVGAGVKLGHELVGVKDEPELTEILRGEAVPETGIAKALEDLRQNQRSTTVTFHHKP